MEVQVIAESGARALRDVSAPRTPSSAFESDVRIPGLDAPPGNVTRSLAGVRPASLNDSVRNRGGVRLHIDEGTNQVVAEIVDKNDEVIRQLPPEEALRIAARFREVIGLIFDITV
ncbi:MAG: flagellar protein FlaG [Candidatus Hydrogenedentes bacterium]|nr:flagellar protein FlaG [Candidatus Hydrogenedentota bacterium]